DDPGPHERLGHPERGTEQADRHRDTAQHEGRFTGAFGFRPLGLDPNDVEEAVRVGAVTWRRDSGRLQRVVGDGRRRVAGPGLAWPVAADPPGLVPAPVPRGARQWRRRDEDVVDGRALPAAREDGGAGLFVEDLQDRVLPTSVTAPADQTVDRSSG